MGVSGPRDVKIAASLMCGNLMDMGREIDVLVAAGVDWLHVDVMDGRYVPSIELGRTFCRAVADRVSTPLDIHLMVEEPDRLVSAFALRPGTVISFHPEVTRQPLRTVQVIRDLGCRPAIALDPAQPVEAVREILPHVDLVCVMCVNPGYAGQKLIPETLGKVETLAQFVRGRDSGLEIEVDGNVSWDNIPRMLSAGATVLVAGSSSLYDGAGLGENIRRIRALTSEPRRG